LGEEITRLISPPDPICALGGGENKPESGVSGSTHQIRKPQLFIVCWTIDWQDNYLWDEQSFLSTSSQLFKESLNLLDGKVTWLAEVDGLTDITRYPKFDTLSQDIIHNGGEIGIHIHHTSVEPAIRHAHYLRAIERLYKWGIEPVSYSAGMGNYINQDTEMLIKAGIKVQRTYTGNYRNAALPSLDWVPPDRRDRLDTLFPQATRELSLDPNLNPVATDWRGASDRAGFLDVGDYRNRLSHGDLFGVPLGILGGNEDGQHQLHVQNCIPLERLKTIFDFYHARCAVEPVFVACYFHPYDLTECCAEPTQRMLSRWKDFISYQNRAGCSFLTLGEAREMYSLMTGGVYHG
jgi:hypothetical protein